MCFSLQGNMRLCAMPVDVAPCNAKISNSNPKVDGLEIRSSTLTSTLDSIYFSNCLHTFSQHCQSCDQKVGEQAPPRGTAGTPKWPETCEAIVLRWLQSSDSGRSLVREDGMHRAPYPSTCTVPPACRSRAFMRISKTCHADMLALSTYPCRRKLADGRHNTVVQSIDTPVGCFGRTR
jgi:hypothetical protein